MTKRVRYLIFTERGVTHNNHIRTAQDLLTIFMKVDTINFLQYAPSYSENRYQICKSS